MTIPHRFLLLFALAVSLLAAIPRLVFIDGLEQLGQQPVLDSSLWLGSLLGGVLVAFITMSFFLYLNVYGFAQLAATSQRWKAWGIKLTTHALLVFILAWISTQAQLIFLENVEATALFLLLNVLRFAFFAAVALITLHLIYLSGRIRQAEEENWQLSMRQVQHQVARLKAQLNPHFLFNSFNALSATIRTEDKEEALHFVEKLSDIFRFSLQIPEDLTPVSKELQLVHTYLYLWKKRYGDKLRIDLALSPQVQDTLIPPMAIQLLVENAIKHNIISTRQPLHIKIEEAADCIQVQNNLQPKPQQALGMHLGLTNLRKRYMLLTQKEIKVYKDENIFQVQLPIIPSEPS